jgi:hypothetical protein
MTLPRSGHVLTTSALALLVTSACGGGGMTPPRFGPATTLRTAPHAIGLGPVLSTKLGGEVLGWDMNQNGNDGVLTEFVIHSRTTTFGTETFDEPAAAITKLVSQKNTLGGNDEPFVQAVMGNDVGFIDVERQVAKEGHSHRDDHFKLMNPVSGMKVDGSSDPPNIVNVVPSFVTNNQSSSTQAMMALRLLPNYQQAVDLYLYNSANNAWLSPHVFPKAFVFAGYALYAAVDARSNHVFVGYQEGSGNYENVPPRIAVFNGATGAPLRRFVGLGKGFLNGMAIDSTTGVLCTTTIGDTNVEFYKDATGKGFEVAIPGGGGPLTQGAAVAVDQVHHLFLIAQQNSTVGPGSAVLVYDEKGNLVESISGFSFLNQFSPVPVHIAVNGAARIGYVPGPNANNLQSFTY